MIKNIIDFINKYGLIEKPPIKELILNDSPTSSHLQKCIKEIAKQSIEVAIVKTDDKQATDSGILINALNQSFPGRGNFVYRFGAIFDRLISRYLNQETQHYNTYNKHIAKPNVLIIGSANVGKTFFLKNVVPKAFDGNNKTKDACVIYIDARHLVSTIVHLRQIGPIPMLKALFTVCDDPSSWLSATPTVVCLDHLESLWTEYDNRRNFLPTTSSVCSALSSIISGVFYSFTEDMELPYRFDENSYLSTGNTVFVAAARLEKLTQVITTRAGEIGLCDVFPEDLHQAGLPKSLTKEFPHLLILQPMDETDFWEVIETENTPAFDSVKKVAQNFNLEIKFENDAKLAIFENCWAGFPDFERLDRLVSLLSWELPLEISSNDIIITRETIEIINMQNKVLPSDVS
ncbi:hypothetical protein [Dethiosulfatarculus sandiegensis]|uniref:Uncharacterized protein n=1 Tax=Dethiosulfatarculus sandiegensis TaxID=1429043 RepID=A0A0D2J383_9BACT|nr:hypothetical protein [Dethiosulfatarculus sandiegensis]KIX12649.1 hypothetical protein X474_18060 [Dethiosulfatarculus sandiegensis]